MVADIGPNQNKGVRCGSCKPTHVANLVLERSKTKQFSMDNLKLTEEWLR